MAGDRRRRGTASTISSSPAHPFVLRRIRSAAGAQAIVRESKICSTRREQRPACLLRELLVPRDRARREAGESPSLPRLPSPLPGRRQPRRCRIRQDGGIRSAAIGSTSFASVAIAIQLARHAPRGGPAAGRSLSGSCRVSGVIRAGRRLRDPRGDRPRRHGRRLQGQAQGLKRLVALKMILTGQMATQRGAAAVSSRGRAGRQSRPSQYRADLSKSPNFKAAHSSA